MALQEIRLISHRYELVDRVGQGGMGAVYRAFDRLARNTVALKQVAAPLDRLVFGGGDESQEDLYRSLAREFRTLATLRHPHIISVLDFGFDEQQVPFYTMDFIEKPVTIEEASAGRNTQEKLDLALQMLQTVAYLHRRGVLHRDLKPDNVLVVDGQVRVMDFGLAIEMAASPATTSEITGTISYMAPELFSGREITRASDLWAVGIMLYELLVGRHPFYKTSMVAMINATINEPVDLTPFEDNPGVAAVIQRLLEKDPTFRYNNANDVIRDLCNAVNFPLPPETQRLRESYLQASKFVGRSEELGQLSNALESALAGVGSAWLIGGESGIGKSRLVEELRIEALTKGVLVVSGRASGDQAAPYALWTEVLRQLTLRGDLTDLEASVLKPLVPDIEKLLGRSVVDAPTLEGQNAQTRLVDTVEQIFRRQTRPLLLILENLHWAADSVALVARLARMMQEVPVLMIATYRNDEAPELPSKLPQMVLMHLRRMGSSEIEQLSTAIMGESGRKDSILQFLQRETEGNALFLVEIIRELAEQAGRIDRIDQITLPQRMLADGIRTPILNRLRRLEDDDRPPLLFAAIAGRELDLKVLEAAFAGFDFENWLVRLSDVSVLEFTDNAWRFAHDKVRDVVISELTSEMQRDLHRSVAMTMEATYPNKPEMARAIAYHWEQALDATKPDVLVLNKAIDALEIAGAHALATYAYSDISVMYERLLELEKLHCTLVENRKGTPIAKERIAAWHAELGYAKETALMFPQASAHFETSADLLGYAIPGDGLPVGIGIFTQIARQFGRRGFRKVFPLTLSDGERKTLERVAHLDGYLGTVYYFTNKPLSGLYVSLRALNIAEKLGPSAELARTYAQMCVLTGTFGMHKQARRYHERAIEVSRQINMPHVEAVVSLTTSIYFLQQTHVKETQEILERALSLAQSAGDVVLIQTLKQIYATSFMVTGQFDRDLELLQEIDQVAARTNDPLRRSNALAYMARVKVIRGQYAAGLRDVELAVSLVEEHALSGPQLIDMWGLSAWVYYHNGEIQRAFEAAEMTYKITHETNTPGSIGMFAYSHIGEVYSALRDSVSATYNGVDLTARLKSVTKSLNTFGVPASKSLGMRLQGLVDLIDGGTVKAIETWRKALAAAEFAKNPLEQGHVHLLLAQHLPQGDSSRQTHRQRANELFSELGAEHYLRIINKETQS